MVKAPVSSNSENEEDRGDVKCQRNRHIKLVSLAMKEQNVTYI
jgi:hypothetical protein